MAHLLPQVTANLMGHLATALESIRLPDWRVLDHSSKISVHPGGCKYRDSWKKEHCQSLFGCTTSMEENCTNRFDGSGVLLEYDNAGFGASKEAAVSVVLKDERDDVVQMACRNPKSPPPVIPTRTRPAPKPKRHWRCRVTERARPRRTGGGAASRNRACRACRSMHGRVRQFLQVADAHVRFFMHAQQDGGAHGQLPVADLADDGRLHFEHPA